MLKVFLDNESTVEDLFHCTSSCSKASLLLEQNCFRSQSVQGYFEHALAGVTDQVDSPVVLTLSDVTFLW